MTADETRQFIAEHLPQAEALSTLFGQGLDATTAYPISAGGQIVFIATFLMRMHKELDVPIPTLMTTLSDILNFLVLADLYMQRTEN